MALAGAVDGGASKEGRLGCRAWSLCALEFCANLLQSRALHGAHRKERVLAQVEFTKMVPG